MQELLSEIEEKFNVLKVESRKTSKAAARRTRVIAMEIAKLLKEFRKESLELERG